MFFIHFIGKEEGRREERFPDKIQSRSSRHICSSLLICFHIATSMGRYRCKGQTVLQKRTAARNMPGQLRQKPPRPRVETKWHHLQWQPLSRKLPLHIGHWCCACHQTAGTDWYLTRQTPLWSDNGSFPYWLSWTRCSIELPTSSLRRCLQRSASTTMSPFAQKQDKTKAKENFLD